MKLKNLLLAFAMLCLANGLFAQTRYYVAPGATGTGSGWADPMDFDLALDLAEPGDEIWMREGTYLPSEVLDPMETFLVPGGIWIYGGFEGWEVALDERSWQAHPTVLSGDLLGNDAVGGSIAADDPDRDDNSYHVVTYSNNGIASLIDGLYVMGGHADGGLDDIINNTGRGGGIFGKNGTLILKNVKLTRNFARAGAALHGREGGALYIYDSWIYDNDAEPNGALAAFQLGNFVADNVVVSQNDAPGAAGVLILEVTMADVTNCTFTTNVSSTGSGSGLFSRDANLYLFNNSFIGNVAGNNGGGAYVQGGTLYANKNNFSSNSADFGGGLCVAICENAVVDSSTFQLNSASFGGGVVISESAAWLSDNVFQINAASLVGGAYAALSSEVALYNNYVFQNYADIYGGAGFLNFSDVFADGNAWVANSANVGGANALLSASSLYDNAAYYYLNFATEGGGLYTASSSNSVWADNAYFEENNAYWGGAFSNNGADFWATVCAFVGNYDYYFGGVGANYFGTVHLGGNYFANNVSYFGDGGAVANTGNLDSWYNEYEANAALNRGGAVFSSGAEVSSRYDVFTNNSAYTGGAAAAYFGATVEFVHGTFTGNASDYVGGALCLTQNQSATVDSSAFSGSTSLYGGACFFESNAATALKNSSVLSSTAEVSGGGVFSFFGNLWVENVSAKFNVSTYGGGLFIDGGETGVKDSDFESNFADYGGGAYAYNGDLNAWGTDFAWNAAFVHGGGLHAEPFDGSAVNFNAWNTNFDYNTAAEYGGGINAFGANVNLYDSRLGANSAQYGGGGAFSGGAHVVSGSWVNDNDADLSGGGLYASGCYMTVSGTSFWADTADYGGGVYNVDSEVEIQDSWMGYCVADMSGGAVYGGNGYTGVLNSRLHHNWAQWGGAAYFNGSEALALLHSSDVDSNLANYGGGAYATSGAFLLTVGSHVWGNAAAVNGGGIMADNAMSDINNSVFNDNAAMNYGGGLNAYQSQIFTIDNDFYGNSADNGGGASLVQSSASLSMDDLWSNTATWNGGGLYADGSGISADEVDSWNNTAMNYGGGVYTYYSNMDYMGGVVSNNSAVYGGGIYNGYAEGTATVNVSGTRIHKNTATEDGGGAFDYWAMANYYDCLVDSNSAVFGGGLCNRGGESSISSTVMHNHASGNGGGVRADNGAMSYIFDSAIEGNTSDASGGGLSLNEAYANVSNTTFTNNWAAGNGGGAWVRMNSEISQFDNTYSGNRVGEAGGGGGLGVSLESLASDHNVTYQNNYSGFGGGALSNRSTYSSWDCTYSGNTATLVGGGLNPFASTVSINNATIAGNIAGIYGGGVAFQRSTAELWNSTVSMNSSDTLGGGCYSSASFTSASGNTFDGNHSYYGGGYLDATSPLQVESEYSSLLWNNAFTNNTAGYGGGAIAYFTRLGNLAPKMKIWDCAFVGNGALAGGAIGGGTGYALYLERNWFNNNAAVVVGGAIYQDSVNYANRLTNNVFVGNSAGQVPGVYLKIGAESWSKVANNTFSDNAGASVKSVYTDGGTATNSAVYGNLTNDAFEGAPLIFPLTGLWKNVYPAGYPLAGANEAAGAANFRDAANGDYRLRYDSYGVERGSNDVLNLTEVDYDQTARLYGRWVDAGAFEYVSYAEIHVNAEGAYCPGDTVKAWYAVTLNAETDGIAPDNVYELWLSDVGGSFESATLIGTLESDALAGWIWGLVPNDATAGNGYKVLVKATRPYVAGYASEGAISVCCPVAYNVGATNIGFNAATITWQHIGNAYSGFRVRYRSLFSSTWEYVVVSGYSANLSGLTAQTRYVVQVQSLCTDDISADWSQLGLFTTASVPVTCENPVFTVATTPTTATVSWTGNPSAMTYFVQYKRTNVSGVWTTVAINAALGTSFTISGLTPGVQYSVRMRMRCESTTTSWSPTVEFTTPLAREAEAAQPATAVSLYPNPAKNEVNIRFESTLEGPVNVTMTDLLGKTVLTAGFEAQKGANVFTVPFDLSAGAYLVRVQGQTTKLIVE